MQQLIISTGSNISPRGYFLNEAHSLLEKEFGRSSSHSLIYGSDAWGFDGLPFLNQVLIFKCQLEAQEVLEKILDIEESLGRKRNPSGYSDRNIDIDILFYGSQIHYSDSLKVPHPLLHKRNFVLNPLAEIAPEFVHPLLKETVASLQFSSEDTINALPFACTMNTSL